MDPTIEWERYRWTSEKGNDFEILREIVLEGYDFPEDEEDFPS